MTDTPAAEPTPPVIPPAAPTPPPKKKHILRNILIAIGSFFVLMVILVSCSIAADSTSSPSDDEDTSASKPEKDAPEPSFAPEPEPEPEQDMNLPFGDALTYVDMVSIAVSKPAEYNPGEYAAGDDQKHNIKINITITNGSDVNLEPSPYGKMSSGGIEGSEIYDGELGGSPDTVILPGKTVTWSEAWSIADPTDIVYQISPSSWEYEDAIYVLGQ